MNDATDSGGAENPTTETRKQVEAAQLGGPVRKKLIIYLVLSAIGFLAIVPLIIWGISVGNSGSASKTDGTPAVARVDRRGAGNCFVGFDGSTCVSLRLTVLPEGEDAFTAAVEVNVEDRLLSKVQPGSYVRVVRDRDNPSKIYLDAAGLENPAPPPPAADASTPAR